MKNFLFLFVLIQFLCVDEYQAQQEKINWITFEQLDDSLKVKPKKTFVFFHAKWCSYCKKMEKVAFKNKEVIQILNEQYYAVKMDAESKKTILFDGEEYNNNQIGKSRRPTHQLAILLASRTQKSFSLPVIIALDEDFNIKLRDFEYVSPKKMIGLLKSK